MILSKVVQNTIIVKVYLVSFIAAIGNITFSYSFEISITKYSSYKILLLSIYMLFATMETKHRTTPRQNNLL